MTSQTPGSALRVAAILSMSEPVVWRLLDIPLQTTFWELHCFLTDIFGWHDSHLHRFDVKIAESVESPRIWEAPISFPIEGDPVIPEWLVTLGDLVAIESPSVALPSIEHFDTNTYRNEGGRIWYHYDYGDSWLVELRVLRYTDARALTCIKGRRAGPPDDFGGISTFNAYVQNSRKADKDRKAWLKEHYPGWKPDTWSPGMVQRTNAQQRLSALLAHLESEGEPITSELSGVELLRSFPAEHPDACKPVIEHRFTHSLCLPVFMVNGEVFLKHYSGDGGIPPRLFSYRYVPGRAPHETVRNQLHSMGDHALILALPPLYAIDGATDRLSIPHICIIPAGELAQAYQAERFFATTCIGRTVDISAAAATTAWALDMTPPRTLLQHAMRELVRLTLYHPHIRTALGLAEGQGLLLTEHIRQGELS